MYATVWQYVLEKLVVNVKADNLINGADSPSEIKPIIHLKWPSIISNETLLLN